MFYQTTGKLENCFGHEWQKLTVYREFWDREGYGQVLEMLCSTVEQQALGYSDHKTVKHNLISQNYPYSTS